MEIKLKAKKSRLPGSGIARVHVNNLEKLGISHGSVVDVAYLDRKVKLVVFGDTLIGDEDIRLREGDLKKLNVKKGDYVSVKSHENKNKKNVKDIVSGLVKHIVSISRRR